MPLCHSNLKLQEGVGVGLLRRPWHISEFESNLWSMHCNMKGGGDIHAIDKPVLSDLKAGIAHRFQAAVWGSV